MCMSACTLVCACKTEEAAEQEQIVKDVLSSKSHWGTWCFCQPQRPTFRYHHSTSESLGGGSRATADHVHQLCQKQGETAKVHHSKWHVKKLPVSKQRHNEKKDCVYTLMLHANDSRQGTTGICR